MLKFNNQPQPPLLPRILNGYLIPFADIFPRDSNSSHKKTPKIEKRTPSKIKIRDRNTVNVQFPIGRNKTKETSLSKVSQTTDLKLYEIQNIIQTEINDDDMFATRRAYSILKKDIKAKMMKYNGDRQQLLTDRSHVSKDILEHINLNQFNKMESEILKVPKKRNFYINKSIMKPTNRDNQIIQNITQWNDIKPSNYEDTHDFFFQQVVEQSLKSQRHPKS